MRTDTKICLAFGICLLLLGNRLFAQAPTKDRAFQIAYHGNYILHPGIKLGYQGLIKTKLKEKQKRKKTKVKQKHWLWEADLIAYSHFDNHSALGLNAGIVYRIEKKKGRFWEMGMSAGVLRTINAGETFSLEQNEIRQRTLAGNTYATTKYFFGIGKDLRKTSGKPIAWVIRPGFGLQYPYNGFVSPILQLETGISYFLN